MSYLGEYIGSPNRLHQKLLHQAGIFLVEKYKKFSPSAPFENLTPQNDWKKYLCKEYTKSCKLKQARATTHKFSPTKIGWRQLHLRKKKLWHRHATNQSMKLSSISDERKKEISQIGSKLKTWSDAERLNKDAPKLISETLKKLQSFLSIWNVTKTSRKIPPSLVNQKKKIIFEIKWREDGRKISTAIESFFEELWMELLFVKVFPAVWFCFDCHWSDDKRIPPQKKKSAENKRLQPIFQHNLHNFSAILFIAKKTFLTQKLFRWFLFLNLQLEMK